MIKHVLRMIWNQRGTNAWIGAELLLISVVLWYVVDFMYATSVLLASPTGFDIGHTYKVEFEKVDELSEAYLTPEQHRSTDAEDLQKALDRIRTYPGVESVSVSMWAMPYSFGNSWAPLTVDTLSAQSQIRCGTPDFFRVFCITNRHGQPIAIKPGEELKSIVLTVDAARVLFDDKEAIGKEVKSPFGDSVFLKVADVTPPYRLTEYKKPNPGAFLLGSEQDLLADEPASNLEICFRVAEGKDSPDFVRTFRKQMKELLRIGNLYLMDIKPVRDIGIAFNRGRGDSNEVKEYGAIAFFLLVNIFLGILGTFWFRTQGRKGEMGLRVALGATPSRLQQLLITEGLVLLTIPFAVAMLVALNMTLMEIPSVDRMDLSVSRFLATAVITYVTMALVIVVGIWYPARQVSKLAPAESLHYE